MKKNAAHRRHAKMVRSMRQREIDLQNELTNKEITRRLLNHIEESHTIRLAEMLGCVTGVMVMIGVGVYFYWT